MRLLYDSKTTCSAFKSKQPVYHGLISKFQILARAVYVVGHSAAKQRVDVELKFSFPY